MIETMTRIKRVYENKQDSFGTDECKYRVEYSPGVGLYVCRYKGKKKGCLNRRNCGSLVCCDAGLDMESSEENSGERETIIKKQSLSDRV